MKMTKIKKEQLQARIQAARASLMEKSPFFGILSMYLKFIAVDDIRNISINGQAIFFNPRFIDRLGPYELEFILCHEVMHIVRGDIWRPLGKAGDDYHRACDIYNNDQLIHCGWKASSFTHFGKLQYELQWPYSGIPIRTLTIEEIMGCMPFRLSSLDEQTRRRYMTDTDAYWDVVDSSELDGVIIIDHPRLTKYAEDLPSFWSGQTQAAADAETKAIGRNQKGGEPREAGSIPEYVKRLFRKEKKQTIDWRKVLHEFLQEEINDYSFAPPDRRYAEEGFFLPDFNEKNYVPKDVLFMVDTSGSVSDRQIGRVYSEIGGAIEQFGGKLKGKLGFFDYDVKPPIAFDNIEDLSGIIPRGGGGTSFSIIFDYIRDHMADNLPAEIVIFTDGYARFPEEDAACGIPVLWVISNNAVTPPWGQVTRIDVGNEFR